MMRRAVLLIVVLIIGILSFVYSGVYNVAADRPHLAVTDWLLQTVRTRSVALRAGDVSAPADIGSAERIKRGAALYGSMCQMCHLAPGMEPTAIHLGLNPKPPVLTEEIAGAAPERLFWIVKHGIKMTGMPAWGETHTDQELWDVVAFLNELPGMAADKYQELTHDAGKHVH